MSGQRGITRLARLYARVEQLRSLERRIAASAVEEIAVAAALHETYCASEISNARFALGSGHWEGWMLAQTARDAAKKSEAHLAAQRQKREATLTFAIEQHRDSRLRMEQMARLAENIRIEYELGEARREQALADDRYGSTFSKLDSVDPAMSEH